MVLSYNVVFRPQCKGDLRILSKSGSKKQKNRGFMVLDASDEGGEGKVK
jgi:hypothetical protein